MQYENVSFIKKIRTRGIAWLLARLLQETQRRTSFVGKFLRPLILVAYWVIMLPINKRKALKSKKKTSTNTLYLFYDLEVSPITFDFAWALVLADCERKRRGLAYIQVVFVPGKKEGLREEDPEYEAQINQFTRSWRSHEILYSLCHLLPQCLGVTLCASREEANILCERVRPHVFPKYYNVIFPIAHTASQALAFKDNTMSVMTLRATIPALHYIKQWLEPRLGNRKLITITLRQSSYMPVRNSNLSAWAEFAASLSAEEFYVVFLPDTEASLLKTPAFLRGFVCFMEPCWNLNLRAALYEISYLNLGVNNGVMALCWLNDTCRYITFKMLVPEAPQTTKESFKSHGFSIGASLPFAGKFQKWVW